MEELGWGLIKLFATLLIVIFWLGFSSDAYDSEGVFGGVFIFLILGLLALGILLIMWG